MVIKKNDCNLEMLLFTYGAPGTATYNYSAFIKY